jgi:hypothetical protein
MKLILIRPGYYKTDQGHEIERFPPLKGSPLTWVLRYPGQATGDVSRPTRREIWDYVQRFPNAS